MPDEGKEDRPKLTVIEGGKGKRTEGLSFDVVDEDLRQITKAAKLKPSKDRPDVLSGKAGEYEITIERYRDLPNSTATLSLFYPPSDPKISFEGFTVTEGEFVTEEQRLSHTEARKGNQDPIITRGPDAKPKIKATLRRVKQITGIIRVSPPVS